MLLTKNSIVAGIAPGYTYFMEDILITKTSMRKLSVNLLADDAMQLFEVIGPVGKRNTVDMVTLSKDEALKLRNILNGMFGGSAEC